MAFLFFLGRDSLFNQKGDQSTTASAFSFLSSLNIAGFFCDTEDLIFIYIDDDDDKKIKQDVKRTSLECEM